MLKPFKNLYNCRFALNMDKLLVIQTAFTGDVVLATAILEKLRSYFPDAQLDLLIRKGNENLLQNNPYLNNLIIWDKTTNKTKNLFNIISKIRHEKYSYVLNLHRYASSGMICFLSGAKYITGYDKNPFSFCFTKKVPHLFSAPGTEKPILETERYQMLIEDITDNKTLLPKLFPSQTDFELTQKYKSGLPYICIAPASNWFTKQFPTQKWIDLLNELPKNYKIYILGGQVNSLLADTILKGTVGHEVENLCGKFTYLQSAALMKDAAMNYVNDSAPLHFASAMAAPVIAIYCSTAPYYGFGPLLESGRIVETTEKLSCRPCGLHGHKSCPKGHFKCAYTITNKQLLQWTTDLKTK